MTNSVILVLYKHPALCRTQCIKIWTSHFVDTRVFLQHCNICVLGVRLSSFDMYVQGINPRSAVQTSALRNFLALLHVIMASTLFTIVCSCLEHNVLVDYGNPFLLDVYMWRHIFDRFSWTQRF